MINVLALKYNSLDAIKFSNNKDFYHELLRAAMEKELISVKEGAEICEAMFKEISMECERWLEENEFDYNIGAYREVYTDNHMTLISMYLFNSKPSEVLEMIMTTAAHEIHENAIKYYRKKVNDILLILLRQEVAIKRISLMPKHYNGLTRAIKDIIDVEGRTELINDAIWYTDYVPLNFLDLSTENIVIYYQNYVEAFILEARMMSKFREQIKIMFGDNYTGNLLNVLMEYIYMLLRKRNSKLPERMKASDKRKLILEQCPEFVFHMLFDCEEQVTFSEEEKGYLRKYLLYGLQRNV